MRVSRQIFNYILTEIGEYIEKTPANLTSTSFNFVSSGTWLYLSRCSRHFLVFQNLLLVKLLTMFVESWFPGCITKTHICLDLMKDGKQNYGVLSKITSSQSAGAWDGFHIYTTTKLKQY